MGFVERHITSMLTRSPSARRVRVGASIAYGLLDTSDETVEDGNGQSKRERLMVLTLPTGALTLAEEGEVIVYATKRADSAQTTYTVRDILLVEDGLVTKYRVVPS